MSLESNWIDWLQKNLPPSPHLGLGDDAAVLTELAAGSRAVLSTDTLTDQVDFLVDQVTPQQIGHKALGVNLSDLAAMAARPVAALVSLVLPRQGTQALSALDLAIGIYQGMFPLAQRHGVAIVGGDTNSWEGPLVVSVTVVGETTPRGPLTRSGGRAGDQLLVTGQLGGSLLGRHLAVEPRIDEALQLHEHHTLHAGIDLSDGLAIDTLRLARASGLGAVLDLAAIPLSDAAHHMPAGRTAVEHALGDGEDFELLLAVPPSERLLQEQPLKVSLTRIGALIDTPGLWQRNPAGQLVPLEPIGFQHGDAR